MVPAAGLYPCTEPGYSKQARGNAITFKGAVSDCDICAVRKAQQLAHPKKVNHKNSWPFQLYHGDLMGPFTPVAMGGYKYVSKITDEYTK